jgi:putative nucleotidyltransferase with HDIG domain
MFLEDVLDGRGTLLFTENTLVKDEHQIEILRRRGVRTVSINVIKGKDVPAPDAGGNSISRENIEREKGYFKEIGRAREIHRESLNTVRETLRTIKLGKTFSASEIISASEEITSSIIRNPDALVSLCQIKGHDEYTYEHCLHVGILISTLAHEMKYSEEDLVQVAIGGLLHDIGKMRVPEEILNKPGKYEPWEFTIMKKHPEHGLAIVGENRMPLSEISLSIIGQHHERLNGSGYPYGKSDRLIPESALMGAVVDVYDALTTDRVYREAWTPQKALATIFQGCDTDYPRMIVERFTKHLGIYPVGSFVRLTSGEMGVVVKVHPGRIMAPEMLVLFDKNGKRLAVPETLDLGGITPAGNTVQSHVEISLDPKPFGIRVADYISSRDE